MGRCLRVLLLEPFLGGSHRAAAEGWVRSSLHQVRIESLPARFWKWRMRGAAFEFVRRLGKAEGCDVLVATDLLDLAHLRALLPRRVPSILYFHENQVAYPFRTQGGSRTRDLQYAFTNLASALAADRVAFNSAFQRDAFLSGLEGLLRRMPDSRPLWAPEAIRRRSAVLPLGVELSDIPERLARGDPPVILWNHRWEHDKGPEVFFNVLIRLAERGVPFRVIVAGESFRRWPPIFESARRQLGARVIHWGYVPSREEYVKLLVRADFTVSTALQENFGLSLLEAAYAGAHPLAPDRLSYPEVLPGVLHRECLYRTEAELEERLWGLLLGQIAPIEKARLRVLFGGCRWEERCRGFDELVWQVFEETEVCYK